MTVRDKERYRDKDGKVTYEKGQSQKWDRKATMMGKKETRMGK